MNDLMFPLAFAVIFLGIVALFVFLIAAGGKFEQKRVQNILSLLNQLDLPVKVKQENEQYVTRYKERPILMTLVDRSTSETEWRLLFTARLQNPHRYELWIAPATGAAGVATGAAAMLMGHGKKRVQVGDRHFDEKYFVASVPPDLATEVLADSQLRAQIREIPLASIYVDEADLQFDPNIRNTTPKDIDQMRLYLEVVANLANAWDRYISRAG